MEETCNGIPWVRSIFILFWSIICELWWKWSINCNGKLGTDLSEGKNIRKCMFCHVTPDNAMRIRVALHSFPSYLLQTEPAAAINIKAAVFHVTLMHAAVHFQTSLWNPGPRVPLTPLVPSAQQIQVPALPGRGGFLLCLFWVLPADGNKRNRVAEQNWFLTMPEEQVRLVLSGRSLCPALFCVTCLTLVQMRVLLLCPAWTPVTSS